MLQFYGTQPPGPLNSLRCGGTCPHCGQRASFTRMQDVIENQAKAAKVREIMVSYHCDACLKPIPIWYDVIDWDPTRVDNPRIALPVVESFDFEHVPSSVAQEVREALGCLSVHAHNGFAAMCRRAVAALIADFGEGGAGRVEAHLVEMLSMSGLAGEWEELARTVLVPSSEDAVEIPDTDETGAAVLLSLLRDLTYQLYTRPGRVRAAATKP